MLSADMTTLFTEALLCWNRFEHLSCNKRKKKEKKSYFPMICGNSLKNTHIWGCWLGVHRLLPNIMYHPINSLFLHGSSLHKVENSVFCLHLPLVGLMSYTAMDRRLSENNLTDKQTV